MSDKQNLSTDKPTISTDSVKKRPVTKVKAYDPSKPHRVIRERLEAIDIINERFASQFRAELFDLLRREIDVVTDCVTTLPYGQFSGNVSPALCLNVMHFEPLKGTALFLISPELIHVIVDHLFGGEGRLPVDRNDREFTRTEQKIIHRVLQSAIEAYQAAWKDIFALTIKHVRSEMQIKLASITTSPNDLILQSSFTVEIAGCRGTFTICIPYSMIEPLRELLVHPPIESARFDKQAWHQLLTTGIKQSNVELVVHFAEISTTINQLSRLKVGDIIPIEKPTILQAMVGKVPVLKGRYGTLNKKYAIQIEQLIRSGLEQLSENKAGDGESADERRE